MGLAAWLYESLCPMSGTTGSPLCAHVHSYWAGEDDDRAATREVSPESSGRDDFQTGSEAQA
ncbi:hypothetical protein BH09PSE1_BH09PSE1_20950 [soil metagenome]